MRLLYLDQGEYLVGGRDDGLPQFLEIAECAPVLVFGFGGLIPFVGLSVLGVFVPGTLHVFWLTTLAQHGAVILAFVGARQLGYAVAGQMPGAQAWIRYGWRVLPALVGCLSLRFPV